MTTRDELRVRLSKGLILDLRSPRALADGLRAYISGESGRGKSSATALVIEQVLAKGSQVVVLDPHGEFGGLEDINPSAIRKLGYEGAQATQESVEECLSIIKDGSSLLIDLSHWALMPKERDAFALAFIKGLFQLRVREPKFTILVLEEASNFAPQSQMSNQMENVLVVVTVLTEGRKHGLGVLVTSQQPSLVDSRVIKGCNLRLLMRISDFGDWKKLRSYVPAELGVTFESLREFESGEAVVLSRWVPNAKVRLLQPTTLLRKAQL